MSDIVELKSVNVLYAFLSMYRQRLKKFFFSGRNWSSVNTVVPFPLYAVPNPTVLKPHVQVCVVSTRDLFEQKVTYPLRCFALERSQVIGLLVTVLMSLLTS